MPNLGRVGPLMLLVWLRPFLRPGICDMASLAACCDLWPGLFEVDDDEDDEAAPDVSSRSECRSTSCCLSVMPYG